MRKVSLADDGDAFDVALFEAPNPSAAVVFAVGGGGSPERHLPMLAALQAAGCVVAAPYFQRLVTPIPSLADLRLRARRTRLALDRVAQSHLPAVGVGHSIGTTVLLALAGGQAWTLDRARLDVNPDARLRRLFLMAPAMGFFRAPGALEAVRLPIQAWVGGKDVITPAAQAELLHQALAGRVPVDLHVVPDADHFSFMNLRPPQTTESLPNRDAFLAELTQALLRFVAD